ncbi:MAG TPA: hypothetical protein DCG63_04705, partial [Methylophilaceae bacterium]|nr:hypothetical protein [Methylophilaceae bacterium]
QTSNTSIDDTEKSVQETNHKSIVSNNGSKTNSRLTQVAFLNAELLNFGGDYRAALFSLNRFVNQLKLNPQVEQVVVLQEPVNVSSLANLQGSTLDENTSERTPAVFKLKIILKPTVETGQQP